MLLTETIKNCTVAIKTRRAANEDKQRAENYAKALGQLVRTSEIISNILDCAAAMKANGIVDTPLIDDTTRAELLDCIDECGNGVSEVTLTPDAVKLLRSNGDAVAARIKIIWKDAAAKYSDGTKGYLSMIGGLSDDPKRAKDLAESIGRTVSGDPTIKAIDSLVADVTAAKKITESFAINAAIEAFLRKVSSQQATVTDLTPEVLTWLKEKKLTSKLKLRF